MYTKVNRTLFVFYFLSCVFLLYCMDQLMNIDSKFKKAKHPQPNKEKQQQTATNPTKKTKGTKASVFINQILFSIGIKMNGMSNRGVEDAAELKFGEEFEDINILSNAQVAVILQVSAASAMNRDEELHDVYRKTQKYVDRFNSMTNPEKNNQEIVKELDNLQE